MIKLLNLRRSDYKLPGFSLDDNLSEHQEITSTIDSGYISIGTFIADNEESKHDPLTLEHQVRWSETAHEAHV